MRKQGDESCGPQHFAGLVGGQAPLTRRREMAATPPFAPQTESGREQPAQKSTAGRHNNELPNGRLGRGEREREETEVNDRKKTKIVNLVVSIVSAILGALGAHFGVIP